MKFPRDATGDPRRTVTPFTGVWIEIWSASEMVRDIRVTPFTGVWIEICIACHHTEPADSHTLHGCVD